MANDAAPVFDNKHPAAHATPAKTTLAGIASVAGDAIAIVLPLLSRDNNGTLDHGRSLIRNPRMDAPTPPGHVPGIPPLLARAILVHAQRQADLTAWFLEARGYGKEKAAKVPRAALLELGAVLELGLWELQGLRPHLDVDLPTFGQAAKDLAERAFHGLAEFEGPDAAPLATRVLQVWIQQFAWDALVMLQADILVSDIDEDACVDLLAEFLWRHRGELASLPSSTEVEQQ